MSVKVTVDRVDVLLRELNTLTKQEVLIGIPAEAAQRDPKDGGKLNNAEIGYIQEFGAPSANIPARPHLVPGVQAYKDVAIKRLKAAANLAMDAAARTPSGLPIDVRRTSRASGGTNDRVSSEVTAQLNAIGLEAVASVKNKITDGLAPPLAPSTLAARKRAGFLGTLPLVRTADYLRHITYVIRKTKG